VREARGLTSSTKTSSPWIANWTFMRPTTLSAFAIATVWRRKLVLHLGREAEGRQRARRVARMHARLLDVLHDAADEDGLAVADRVDVHLDRVVEEAVDEHGESLETFTALRM
jgi:hypothetical protein